MFVGNLGSIQHSLRPPNESDRTRYRAMSERPACREQISIPVPRLEHSMPRSSGNIAAAVSAYIATHRRPWLTSDATRLLTAMMRTYANAAS
jgi:hypothetical protein